MTEFDLIRRLMPLLPTNDFVVVGAGDDCAVLELGASDTQTLFKADAVVEGVHFAADADPVRVGHKALARSLSDVAAMGGTPTAALVTLALPAGFDPDRVLGFYRGMQRLAVRHQVALVGGETTASPGGLLLNVAVLGTVPRGRALLRTGAQAGDAVFVTGELGGSIEGHHLDFEPRLAEGRWLASSGLVHAMMDLSDGLASDLPKLLEAGGGLGAEIRKGSLPIRRAARLRERQGDLAKPAALAALTDGEDFELLLTTAPGDAVRLLDEWKRAFPGVRLTCIGRLTANRGVFLTGPTGRRPMPVSGYEHFGPGPN
ncbi:MAG: thiamine-monophosphate kinase [Verrucomicrobiae bacterium]|nr:thiamine-monophosphate kinase [Verrucomicrobiae bacterium]